MAITSHFAFNRICLPAKIASQTVTIYILTPKQYTYDENDMSRMKFAWYSLEKEKARVLIETELKDTSTLTHKRGKPAFRVNQKTLKSFYWYT